MGEERGDEEHRGKHHRPPPLHKAEEQPQHRKPRDGPVQRQFVQLPTLIVEVLSPSTETIDRREKKMNYLQVQTLEEYVLVAQERREVTLFRCATG